jgi:PAS domain S-box-containing protein
MFGLSIVVAVVLATLALWVRFGLSQRAHRLREGYRLLLAAIVMGCAIAGMHYTGMAAARFVGHRHGLTAPRQSSTFLALAITLITVAFTSWCWANGLLRYRQLFRELSRSEAWMRALLTTTVDGVITVDRDGTILEFNASAERIYGWKRDEIVGQHIRILIGNEEKSEQVGLLRALRTPARSRAHAPGADVTGRRKDGSIVPIRRAVGHARLDGKDLFVCFITDISERRAMEQALRASEQQFRSLIGNIPGISYRSLPKASSPMVFISDAVERITGYPARDFLGAAPRRSFAP